MVRLPAASDVNKARRLRRVGEGWDLQGLQRGAQTLRRETRNQGKL
jgi:hypothetical protein